MQADSHATWADLYFLVVIGVYQAQHHEHHQNVKFYFQCFQITQFKYYSIFLDSSLSGQKSSSFKSEGNLLAESEVN